jgi:hypothetical protein
VYSISPGGAGFVYPLVWWWGGQQAADCPSFLVSYPSQLVSIPGVSGVSTISSDLFETCGISAGGYAWCSPAPWIEDYGCADRPPAPTACILTPHPIAQTLAPLAAILYVGRFCVIRAADGTVWCGADETGYQQIVGLDGVVELAGGPLWVYPNDFPSQTCALRQDGSIWCWSASGSPAQVESSSGGPLLGATDLADNGSYGCAVVSGVVNCWGVLTDPLGYPVEPVPTDLLTASPVWLPCPAESGL